MAVDVELHAVPAHQGGELRLQAGIVAIEARGIDGVMAHHHLPGGGAAGQHAAQPAHLALPVGLAIGIEQEELHRAAAQVVEAPLHAEGLVGHLRITVGGADVVVAEHGMKGHAGGQQIRIGPPEGGLDQGHVAGGVDVVAPQHHQIHRPAPMHRRHLLAHSPLVGIAAAGICHRQPTQALAGFSRLEGLQPGQAGTRQRGRQQAKQGATTHGSSAQSPPSLADPPGAQRYTAKASSRVRQCSWRRASGRSMRMPPAKANSQLRRSMSAATVQGGRSISTG